MKKPVPFGKYYLLERINVGGMAEVFRAKAYGVEGFERLVAVKRILPNIAEDQEFIKMFVDEAKIAVQLSHANIAQIFDLGVVDSSYYIALEHIHGRDLRAIFDRSRQLGEPMPIAQACFIVMKISEGLDYAHNKRDQSGRELGLVHRDVSPQNMLVSFEGEVKVIDFGIAKAAGKGNKTQAGILKGKFGYMSPEQVRGLPIDRRSDIFSAGIVLYELLTGERLFVGESDFSTLEKVRNVEILPPSTYNRKIPDELERIVLKALAKDVDDRYQNAIDLHDELQAFVYTVGEFYSRKDLATWMKKTFSKEIEEETAKLESFRQLKAPPELQPAGASNGGLPAMGRAASTTKSPPQVPGRRATSGMPATKPPPTPPGRMTGQMAAVPASAASGAAAAQRRASEGHIARDATNPTTREGLVWDDDELETQIYDDDVAGGNPDTKPEGVKQRSPRRTTSGPGVGVTATTMPIVPNPSGPDLSSLATTAKGWDAPKSAKVVELGGQTMISDMSGMQEVAAAMAAASAVAPTPAMIGTRPSSNSGRMGEGTDAQRREASASVRMVEPEDAVFLDTAGRDDMFPRRAPNKIVYIALGSVLAAISITVVVLAATHHKKPVTPPVVANSKPVPAPPQPVVAPPAPPVAGDQNTGFDLYVNTSGVAQWRLDGESRTDRLPSRIRGVAPGPHTVVIDPPPGFLSGSQQIVVVQGQAPKLEVKLSPMEIVGKFESSPPGAMITLIVDGTRTSLGEAPAHAKLDPTKSYAVLFERPGYIAVNRPIALHGTPEELVNVTLEPAAVVRPGVGPVTAPSDVDHSKPGKNPVAPAVVKSDPKAPSEPPVAPPETTQVEKPAPAADGTLALGSKPPCEIFVDGRDLGMKTPQREIKLSAGKHKITLMNNEFSIKENFTVDIKSGEATRAVKDFSAQINTDNATPSE